LPESIEPSPIGRRLDCIRGEPSLAPAERLARIGRKPMELTMSGFDFKAHLRSSMISNFVFNLLINGALAWWLLEGSGTLTAWGAPSYGPDLMITGFLLAAIVAGIVIEINRRKARRGEIPALRATSPILRAASARSRWLTCISIGLVGTFLSALAVLLVAATTASLSVPIYAGVKGVWAGVLAAAVVGPATLIGVGIGAAERTAA